jgi:hypothetical protein
MGLEQSRLQRWSGVLQALPACGSGYGQPPAERSRQLHWGGFTVWQTGNEEPPTHSLQWQAVPPEYQQASEVSAQVEAFAGGAGGHAAGRRGTHRGAVIVHIPFSQSAVVLQLGRGSSPQLQCAEGSPLNPPAGCVQGGVHGAPLTGGELGQLVLPLWPPVDRLPPPEAAPPLVAPPFDTPPLDAPPLPPDAPPFDAPPFPPP